MVSPQAGGGRLVRILNVIAQCPARMATDWRKNLTRMLTGHTCIRSLNKILNNSYILECKS